VPQRITDDPSFVLAIACVKVLTTPVT